MVSFPALIRSGPTCSSAVYGPTQPRDGLRRFAVAEQFPRRRPTFSHQRVAPYAEIDVLAIAHSAAGAAAISSRDHHAVPSLFSKPACRRPLAGQHTTRCTNTPVGGCRRVALTGLDELLATSAMVMRPPIAATGLKLRAAYCSEGCVPVAPLPRAYEGVIGTIACPRRTAGPAPPPRVVGRSSLP